MPVTERRALVTGPGGVGRPAEAGMTWEALAGRPRVLGRFGDLGGTNTAEAVRRHYRKHDRVLIVTDEQGLVHAPRRRHRGIGPTVPVHTWNLAGYTGSGTRRPGARTATLSGGFPTRHSAWCPCWRRAGAPTGPGTADYKTATTAAPGAVGHGVGRSQGAYST
ncbi:hypothetical protein QFZ58_005517 [Streptomyces sp. B1I3]|nr:hypothetical protein [Streptomyces sp. B1I3]